MGSQDYDATFGCQYIPELTPLGIIDVFRVLLLYCCFYCVVVKIILIKTVTKAMANQFTKSRAVSEKQVRRNGEI
jgi:hypothetical protein